MPVVRAKDALQVRVDPSVGEHVALFESVHGEQAVEPGADQLPAGQSLQTGAEIAVCGTRM